MIYLDNAATLWPKPPDVLERAGDNPGRSGHRLSTAAPQEIHDDRRCTYGNTGDKKGWSVVTYGVVLFHTTASALLAEKLLKKDGYDIKLIPIPRQFSSDCGIALRFSWNEYEEVKSVLDVARVEIEAIHRM